MATKTYTEAELNTLPKKKLTRVLRDMGLNPNMIGRKKDDLIAGILTAQGEDEDVDIGELASAARGDQGLVEHPAGTKPETPAEEGPKKDAEEADVEFRRYSVTLGGLGPIELKARSEKEAFAMFCKNHGVLGSDHKPLVLALPPLAEEAEGLTA